MLLSMVMFMATVRNYDDDYSCDYECDSPYGLNEQKGNIVAVYAFYQFDKNKNKIKIPGDRAPAVRNSNCPLIHLVRGSSACGENDGNNCSSRIDNVDVMESHMAARKMTMSGSLMSLNRYRLNSGWVVHSG